MKSLESLIDTRKKLEEVNMHISSIWIRIITLPTLVVIGLFIGIHSRVNFLNDLNTKNKFICKSFLKDQFSIIINKKDGWRVKDGYFIKGKSKIRTDKCKALKEKSYE